MLLGVQFSPFNNLNSFNIFFSFYLSYNLKQYYNPNTCCYSFIIQLFRDQSLLIMHIYSAYNFCLGSLFLYSNTCYRYWL